MAAWQFPSLFVWVRVLVLLLKTNYGLVTELARRTCLRSKRPMGMWVQLPPGLLIGELPLIGKGAVLKTAVGNHLGVQVSHSPLNASVA